MGGEFTNQLAHCSSVLAVGNHLSNEERKLVVHVYASTVFLDELILALGEREEDLNNLPRDRQPPRASLDRR